MGCWLRWEGGYQEPYVPGNQFDGEGEGQVVGNLHESPNNVFLWLVDASYREGKWMEMDERMGEAVRGVIWVR